MAVLSKDKLKLSEIIQYFLLGNKKKKILNMSILAVISFLLLNYLKSKKLDKKLLQQIPQKLAEKKEEKGKGKVDKEFLHRLLFLLKIAIPSLYSMEFLDLSLLTIFLLLRTYLSIYLATVKGRIVKGIVQMDLKLFLKGLLNMFLCAFPGSFINSALSYFQTALSIRFRKRITMYFMDRYLDQLVYYQITNLDQRVANPDQRLTSDIHKWSVQLSSLYSNISKPILDIFLYSRKLSTLIGLKGPIYLIIWYLFTGFVLKNVSPVFGKLIAMEQKLEGFYRSKHNDIVNHSEEIAFYKGQQWEKQVTTQAFKNLHDQSLTIINKRLNMGMFDSILVKYGSFMVGYGIIGIPVFGKNNFKYLQQTEKDAAKLTRDYIRNSSLLIDLAGAIGRLLVSYKTLQLLAGYNTLVYEMVEVFDDLDKGKFQRLTISAKVNKNSNNSLIINNLNNENEQKVKTIEKQKESIMKIDNRIMFKNVPIISPAGETLVTRIDFEIKQGMNCIVIGPNGCGKSSCFRILAQLWPQNGGELIRPSMREMFYIPQRPYLPKGSLRDQIIYPHRLSECLKTDEQLEQIIKEVDMNQILENNSIDTYRDWNEFLSGGEKQRLAMARLFYHKPQFAILDECTSSTSLDAEILLYNKCKEYGITLFTISHRSTLFKFHDYMLIFDGEGGYSFEKIEHQSGKESQLFQQAMKKKINQAMISKKSISRKVQ